ncbi:MAG: hypothetical protein KDI63_08600 [Gammaproteobacteria bacterium]|nr:hypothetical protein [Gammaproteobacteria bacterium]
MNPPNQLSAGARFDMYQPAATLAALLASEPRVVVESPWTIKQSTLGGRPAQRPPCGF